MKNLPEDIIFYIYNFLPFEDVVKTSLSCSRYFKVFKSFLPYSSVELNNYLKISDHQLQLMRYRDFKVIYQFYKNDYIYIRNIHLAYKNTMQLLYQMPDKVFRDYKIMCYCIFIGCSIFLWVQLLLT